MLDKDAVALKLAEAHYRFDPGIIEVRRVVTPPDIECRPDEPIKLLEVNRYAIPSGVLPLYFGPAPESGISFPSTIIEVTPDEFESIKIGELMLPENWRLGDLLPRPVDMVAPSA